MRKYFANKENINPQRKREKPPQLNSPDLGSPQKVWNSLCIKDEKLIRGRNIFKRHPLITADMRTVLLEWIMQVCFDRRLHRETYHLCVDYVDRYLELSSNVKPDHLQLIGSAALIIASKIEEIYPPKISEIADFTDNSCGEESLRNMEEILLQSLSWCCNTVTTIHWLSIYLQLMYTKGVSNHKPVIEHAAKGSRKKVDASLASISNSSLSQEEEEENESKYADDSANAECSTSSELSAFSFASRNGSCDELLFDESADCVRHTLHTDKHIYPDYQSCTVSRLVREEFVRLAMVVDLIMLNADSVNFKYSELAAGIISCCFEPQSIVKQVTGYTSHQLELVCEFVKPFITACERLTPAGVCIPSFSDVPSKDSHNIQTCIPDAVRELQVIQLEREATSSKTKITVNSKQIINRHFTKVMASVDCSVRMAAAEKQRKRKFGETGGTIK